MKIIRYSIYLLLFILLSSFLYSENDILKGILPNRDQEYILRLNNGDIISGFVIEMVNDPEDGEGIKLKTVVGNAIIFANQIVEITAKEEHYRHGHSVYLLPSAEPISNNHFIGMYELMFLYAGVGIGDIVSITAGHSFLPGISSNQQISVMNVKLSLLSLEFEDVARKMTLAIGGNLAFVNSYNRFIHLYGVGTVELSRTKLTASVFAKTGSKDVYDLYFGSNRINLIYEDGSFGIALGLDTKLTKRHDFHLIGELWNSNVAKPINTAVLLGFRLCNSSFSSDFGITFVTVPYMIPFVSFKWTPF
ncbi:MAG: hypothetical protein EPN82_02190 [Bacteroidetes bacterium]|nr:MAG: hypothetical protein EPN82_02190 [Bacteroidota bacterium]